MISKAEQIQIHYEFAMSIGCSLDLNKMLRKSLSTVMRKLNCPTGGVLFYSPCNEKSNIKTKERHQLESIITIPRNTSLSHAYQKAMAHIPTVLSSQSLTAFYDTLPLSGETDTSCFAIMKVLGLGVLILTNNSNLDLQLLKSLDPILEKLAVACRACLQNEELLRYQKYQQEMITESTKQLVRKNLQLTKEIEYRKISEQRFKLVAEAISDLVYEWDLKDDTLHWFGDIDSALGYEQGEFPHTLTAWRERIHPQDMAQMHDAVQRHRTSTKPISYEYKVKCKDGSWVFWSDYGIPISERDGKPCKWIGACTNITDKKKAEHELIESEHLLAETQKLAQLGSWEFDVTTEEIKWSAETFRIAGMSPKDKLALQEYLDMVHPDDLPLLQEALEKSIAEQKPYELELRQRRPDGSYNYTLTHGKPIVLDNQITKFIGSVLDITDRKAAEQELQRAKEEAEAANTAKSAFLANMSHELRTPLNAIIGFSELMTRDNSLSSDNLQDLSTIIHSGEHLLSLINDVLEFSKIEAGQLEIHLDNFDLHRFLNNLAEMFRLRARQKGLYLNLDLDPKLPRYIRADQGKLRQILINLLGNGVKFTQKGGVTLRVNANVLSTQIPSLSFEVIDTGLGIAGNKQAQVFDSFFQTGDRQLAVQGTGLGLPISKRLVGIMAGKLELDSIPDQGTKFSFAIPVENISSTEIILPQLPRRIRGLEAGQEGVRLLVVEDNDNNRNLLVRLLKDVGFIVKEAVTGQEAIETWKKWLPHLIWMDIRMPVMDGYEATRRIKKSPGGDGVVIIALTASAFDEDRQKIIDQGGNDFVRKPVRESEIFGMLEKHLGVKFIYEPEDGNCIEGPWQPRVTTDLKAGIAALPVELIARLVESTELSDVAGIDQVIYDIRTNNTPLAETLAVLAGNFAYDEILSLVKK